MNFAAFMRLSAGPKPAPAAASVTRGQQAFVNVGCNLCHIAQHTTAKSIFTNQSSVTFSPFSDFELHDMGTGLQDQISQGQAEGRTQNLLQAILAHSSNGSEANTVIGNFNALPASSQQDMLNFLRSL